MRHELLVTNICYTPAGAALRATGLRGWASCRLDGRWHLDGLAVRRTAAGQYVVSFPTRPDRNGGQHPIFRPISLEDRSEIERQILDEVRRRGFIS